MPRCVLVLALWLLSLAALPGQAPTDGDAGDSSPTSLIRENTVGQAGLVAALRAFAPGLGFVSAELDQSPVFGHSFAAPVSLESSGAKGSFITIALRVDDDMRHPRTATRSAWLARALMTHYAAISSEAGLPFGLRLLLLPSERLDAVASDRYFGSSIAASVLSGGDPTAVIVVNVTGAPEAIELSNLGSGTLSPYWLYEAANAAFTSMKGADVGMRANRSVVFRLGLNDETTALDPWFRKGIPAILVNARPSASGGGDPRASEAAFVDSLWRLVTVLGKGIPDQWDRQYLMFGSGALVLSVRETGLMLICLLAVASFIAFTSVRGIRRTALKREGVLLRSALIASTLGICIAAFALSGAVSDLGRSLWGASGLWVARPIPYSIFRMLAAVTLVASMAALLSTLLWKTEESHRSAAALALLGIDVVFFSFMRLSFSVFFLWPFIAFMVADRIRSRLAGAIGILVAALPFAFVFMDIMGTPEIAFVRRIMESGPFDTLMLASASAPFALWIVHLGRGNPTRARRIRGAVTLATAFLMVTVAESAYTAILASRGGVGGIPVDVVETRAPGGRSARFALESPFPNPKPRFTDANGTVMAEREGAVWSVPLAAAYTPYETTVSDRLYLGRRTVGILVSSVEKPLTLEVSFEGEHSFSVFDCNFPMRISPDGMRIDVAIGRNPPVKVEIRLTVSTDFSASCVLRVGYDPADSGIGLEDCVVGSRALWYESRLVVNAR